ncbi:CPBP family intramembrane glutamic endopeptidase [Halorussus salinisoli]|uniref:CPBP family intramembrane glutamic endopeptidase n=1 Tax=Halorussus salinisoli TaxID=2558242 RepID=UPI002A911860|nr:CPBP family glutamic-type intramembrane protease [Halorussus salinisoli]
MPPAPQYPSFAAVTMFVLGLLIVLARASQAMFEDSEESDERADAESESRVPATGAARIERHAETGRTRAERIEREILDGDEADADPWSDEAGDSSPWGDDEAETDARRARERASDESGRATDERGREQEQVAEGRDRPTGEREQPTREQNLDFSTGALLTNVALSQGVFGAVIVAAAWLAAVPLGALGVEVGNPWNVGLPAVGVGVGVGVALYLANELSAKAADTADVDYSEDLREALAPDTLRGWAILLAVVLPVIAGFEELLFRAALVGAFSAGFGLSPWLLAVFSTVAFAIGHGAQGPGGVAVTGLLGFALAVAFVLSGSLLVVVVAHYVVNALEFVVHEGLDIEWV